MPKSALPEHLNDPEDIEANFRDDDQYGDNWFGRLYRSVRKATRTWIAFGPRATERWAKWREVPYPLFCRKGEGPWRWEYTDASQLEILDWDRPLRDKSLYNANYYVSVIQYWSKWHIQIQWPFFVAFHYYIDEVPRFPDKATTQRVLYFRFGARRDADRVYWFPSLFIGLSWN